MKTGVAAACCFVQQNEHCILSRRRLLQEWQAVGILENKMIVGGYVLRAGGVRYRHFYSL
jgi:hypothetical protein